MEVLVRAGANLNADQDGWTSLALAAYNGYENITNILVSAGAQLDAQTEYLGRTALMWACVRGHTQIVEILTTNGANLNMKDKDGFTALGLAKKSANADIETLLRGVGAF